MSQLKCLDSPSTHSGRPLEFCGRPNHGILHTSLWSKICAILIGGAAIVVVTLSAQAQSAGRAFKGDFDGDRKTDLAFWNYAELTWYIANSSDNSVKSQAWGSPNPPYNDIPLLADYDGDKKTDLAVWRPSEG